MSKGLHEGDNVIPTTFGPVLSMGDKGCQVMCGLGSLLNSYNHSGLEFGGTGSSSPEPL
jgi:hypothetical protein